MTAATVRGGRRRFFPRVTIGRALVLAVTIMAGFVAVTQLRGTARAHATLAGDSPEDLTRILASLNTGADALNSEIGNLKLQLLSLQNSTQRDSAARQASEDRLRSLEVLAGTVPVFGPGIQARVDDPKGTVTYDVLIGAVEELRDAGAEAVAIDGRRVGATSWLGASPDGLTLDGSTLPRPFLLEAVGDPATLDSGLKIPGGAVDALTALAGVGVNIHRQARVDLPALGHPPPSLQPVR